MRRLNIDLLHCNTLKADIVGTVGVKMRRLRFPVVWHIHDRISADYLPPRVARLFCRLCARWPTHVIVNSEATRQSMDLPRPQDVTTIYSGLDLSRFLAIPAPAQRWNGKPGPLIGIVGRLARWKGQHIFLQAAAQVLKEFPGARFQIVGGALFSETDYEAYLRDLTRRLGLTQRVEFAGFRFDVPPLFAEMDVVVHASITPEPFGQVVVQGMAAGKPVIATDGGGVREIVINEESGLLVPLADADAMARAIIRILKNQTLAQKLAHNGRIRAAERFAVGHVAEQTMDLYDRLLSPAPLPRPAAAN